MITAVPGARSRICFVASRPSIPGMRTSMITTSGFRRSARATAPAPSDASPTTRMCDARESERRSPSRTTSWSSTIRQVISSGTAPGLYDPPLRVLLDGNGKLLRLGRRREPPRPAIGDSVLGAELRDPLPDRRRGLLRQVGAPAVDPLVVLELLGPVARERLEEMLARAGLEVEHVAPEMS